VDVASSLAQDVILKNISGKKTDAVLDIKDSNEVSVRVTEYP
jgi:hypothetical protein